MLLAIISDIHGNIEAFEAVMAFCEAKRVSKIACLGDVVGYGPNPNECVELLEEVADIKIMGNHDHGVLGETEIGRFNRLAADAIRWTQKNLNENSMKSISKYHIIHTRENIHFAHASFSTPGRWNYILNETDTKEEMKNISESNICFIGHTHIPFAYSRDGYIHQDSFKLKNENAYILNVGSVGQPRDGDRSASFGILDMDELTYQKIKIEYAYKKTMKKIYKAGLPPFLGARLALGK